MAQSDARLRAGMQVRDYTKLGTNAYGSLWEVVSVELRVEGVMDFLQESIYLLTLTDGVEIRTVLIPASAPGYAVLLPELRLAPTAVPVACALPLVGYPIADSGFQRLAEVAGQPGWPAGIAVLTALALRTNWETGDRYYRLSLSGAGGLEYGFDIPEQDAQVLTIQPAEYPASQYTLEALGRI